MAGNMRFQETYLKYADKLPSKPRLQLAILTCIDTRLNPIRIFHINVGDAIILRNAGSKITDDVIRSINIAITNGVTEIIILGHTDCKDLTDSKLLSQTIRDFLKGGIDEEANVKEQVSILRSNSAIPKDIPIHGLLFDVTNGSLKLIVNGYRSRVQLRAPSITSPFIMPSIKMPSLSGSLSSSFEKKKSSP